MFFQAREGLEKDVLSKKEKCCEVAAVKTDLVA